MLALALMPTVSRALAHAGDADALGQVCSAGGALPADAPGGDAAHLDHCPLCVLQAHAWSLPPALPQPLAALPLGEAAAPRAFLSAPRTLFAWRAAQPRAPPSRT